MVVASLLLCYLLVFALFWLPAAAAARALWGRSGVAGPLLDLLALVTAAAVTYLVFWAWLAHPALGWCASGGALVAGAAAVVAHWRRGEGGVRRLLTTPALLALFLGLLYTGLVSLHGGVEAVPSWFVRGVGEDPAASLYWVATRDVDSLIPVKLAAAVARREPLRGDVNFGRWRFSDRPPLQAGAILWFWPLAPLFGVGVVGLAVGVALQVQWVVGLWAAAWALGHGRGRATYAVLVAGASGFAYHNSVYLWPKMIAAALSLAALAPIALAWRERRRLTGAETLLASSAATLALLAHGTVAFSLLPLAALCLLRPRLRRLGTVLPAAGGARAH